MVLVFTRYAKLPDVLPSSKTLLSPVVPCPGTRSAFDTAQTRIRDFQQSAQTCIRCLIALIKKNFAERRNSLFMCRNKGRPFVPRQMQSDSFHRLRQPHWLTSSIVHAVEQATTHRSNFSQEIQKRGGITQITESAISDHFTLRFPGFQ